MRMLNWFGRWPLLFVLFFCALTSLGAAQGSSVLAAEDAEIGEFVAFCDFSHRAADDPIVIPGLPGGSHNHEFFGSVVTGAATQLTDLLEADTTCDPVGDRSAYWVPTLYDGAGNPVAFENGTFYYLVHVDNHADVQQYPLGLKVIAGNAAATGPGQAQHIKWSCLGSGVSSTSNIVECPAGSRLELLLNFPDCWDGINLDSADHKSHMAYSAGGACPSTHPVVVPALQFKLRYATRGGTDFTLSSGPGYTAHGDFFNAWEPAALENRLECLRTLTKCGPEGHPQEVTAGGTVFLPMLSR